MEGFKAKEYKIFELFDKQWAIVTAGSMAHYNSCTVSWGSLGNIWGHAGHSCPIVTVYVHPARYTSEFLRDSDIFTVSFYPESCRKALSYIGSHSGRDGDKIAAAGLTPVVMGQGVTFREANLTFLCKSCISTNSPEMIWPRKFRRITPLRRRCTRTFRAAGSRTCSLWGRSQTSGTTGEGESRKTCRHIAEKPLRAAFLLYGEDRDSKVAWKLLYKIIDTAPF